MSFTQNNWELNQVVFIKLKSAVVLSVAPTLVVSVAVWNLLKGKFVFKLICGGSNSIYPYYQVVSHHAFTKSLASLLPAKGTEYSSTKEHFMLFKGEQDNSVGCRPMNESQSWDGQIWENQKIIKNIIIKVTVIIK